MKKQNLIEKNYYNAYLPDTPEAGEFKIRILGVTEDNVLALLNPDSYIEFFEKLNDLTIKELFEGKAYHIDEELNDDIVVYTYKTNRLETCLGFEIKIEDKI